MLTNKQKGVKINTAAETANNFEKRNLKKLKKCLTSQTTSVKITPVAAGKAKTTKMYLDK